MGKCIGSFTDHDIIVQVSIQFSTFLCHIYAYSYANNGKSKASEVLVNISDSLKV